MATNATMIQQCSTLSHWNSQLRRTRAEREKFVSGVDTAIVEPVEFLKHVRSLYNDVQVQLRTSCGSYVESTTTSTVQQQNRYDRELQSALRVALCCVSIPPQHRHLDEIRRTIQQESFDSWHTDLLAMILNKNINESCRILAAQVLCNTITDCSQTALRFMNGIRPAPSEAVIAQQLRNEMLASLSTATTVTRKTTTTTDVDRSESISRLSHPKSTMLHDTTNWVDLILGGTTHRPLLAIIVACLHNSICSVTKIKLVDTSVNSNDSRVDHVLRKIATSTLLISTLLRHIVSALSVIEVTPADNVTTTDEATEWIVLLISKLCRLGLLPEMYQSISGSGDPGRNGDFNVYPEHVVLLHTVRNVVEEIQNAGVSIESSGVGVDRKSRSYCLGGENSLENGTSIIDTHCFLAELCTSLSTPRSVSPDQVDDIVTLQASVLQLVLDILAETLSEDSTLSNRIRHALGSTTTILESIVYDCARHLDQWHSVNKDLPARNQSKLNETDQCRITTSVRVIGNLCFHCRQNQDLLRSIKVPNTVRHNQSEPEKSERNGLHVLLSTTSMSYSCFTLREWAVVAIRSVLEDCPENQAIVFQLEGQTAMQTADLEDMGIRVNLNVPTGTVTVDQLDKK